MRLSKGLLLAGLTISTSLAWLGATQAQTPEEFYKGKTVTLVVSAAGGSASDALGRLFVDVLKKHFPGNPEFIVQNKEGAGGLVAATQLQNTEAKDGTVIALLQRNNLYIPLVTNKQEQFDPRKVTWVGSIDGGEYPNAIVAFKHSPVQSADEMFTKAMIIGSTSFTHENRAIPAMMNAYLGTKFKIVPGYKGRGEVYLAMERGEADGWMQGYNTLATPDGGGDYVKQGLMKPIVTIGLERSKDYPDVPSLGDLVKDDEQKSVVKFFMAPLQAGRPFAVPGGVPEDRVAAIRKAFEDTFADPEAIAQMEKALNSSVALITGPQIEGLIDDVYGVSDKTLEGVRDILIKK